jgi:hypothetical protein
LFLNAAGIGHLAVGEQADHAVVGDVVLLVRRHHLEAEAAGVVRGDRRCAAA